MGKLILIFSDGTGQIGGLSPDQCLSNVYKMYRAMRPWPDSPIKPEEQVAFYDPGLGAGESGGLTFRRIRKIFESAIGTGIDQNIVDCYSAIIANYEQGDRICLFGFSRGAYTVRSLANVLNLCGVPTKGSDGKAVPRHGPKLRKIANDAVRYVYNHGAGHERSKFESERDAKAERFRQKYGSGGSGADGEPQGNVQPEFIGVFDTVAALRSRSATVLACFVLLFLLFSLVFAFFFGPFWLAMLIALTLTVAGLLTAGAFMGQIKYFFPDPSRKPRFWNPLDWPGLFRHGHIAWWNGRNFDKYVDREVPYLRHALAIDEERRNFDRVPWGRLEDVQWNIARGKSDWLRQVWFAGNHSDIGGSYPEPESRLSDVALQWMLDELKAAVPQVRIRDEIIVTSPDAGGLQHDECEALLDRQPALLRRLTCEKLTWPRALREIADGVRLHPTVIDRFKRKAVPQMGDVKPYRPVNLACHPETKSFYIDVA